MKSIYFRNFSATALMVMMSFLMVGVAFVFLGRDFIISSHRESMEDSAEVVSLMVLTKFDAGVYTAESVNGVLSSPEVRVLLNGASLLSGNDIIVTNARHYEALLNAHDAILRTLNGLQSGLSGDFLAQDIRECMHYLGEITGQISTDEILGTIFSKFCIGK